MEGADLAPSRAVVTVPAISPFSPMSAASLKTMGTSKEARSYSGGSQRFPNMMLLRIGVFLGVHAGILLGVMAFL